MNELLLIFLHRVEIIKGNYKCTHLETITLRKIYIKQDVCTTRITQMETKTVEIEGSFILRNGI